MDRTRRLIGFWNWLPAFRVVAETEHLPTASEQLRVSPSALSRSIRLLEDALGEELFERKGRSLVLTEAGSDFLISVRRAMRVLDDGVERMGGGKVRGALRVACPGPFASLYVLPALQVLRTQHPELLPEISSLDAERANAQLLAGVLDLALLDDPVPNPQLVIERLAHIAYGVYCGRSHDLYAKAEPSIEEICEHTFAGPPGGDDHWPVDISRKVGAHLAHLQLGIDFCLTGDYLAVLPDAIAREHVAAGRLRRLPFERFETTSIYAVYREPLGSVTKLDALLPLLRQTTSGQGT